jgi:hypothetical protein
MEPLRAPLFSLMEWKYCITPFFITLSNCVLKEREKLCRKLFFFKCSLSSGCFILLWWYIRKSDFIRCIFVHSSLGTPCWVVVIEYGFIRYYNNSKIAKWKTSKLERPEAFPSHLILNYLPSFWTLHTFSSLLSSIFNLFFSWRSIRSLATGSNI